MSRAVVVYGAGGHGKVVADALLRAGAQVLGFVDDAPEGANPVLGLPVLGGGSWLSGRLDLAVALGIGNNLARRVVGERCLAQGHEMQVVVHPSATVSVSARIAQGAVVLAGAVVNPDALLEAGAIVNSGAVIEHDCIVGAYAHVSPNAVLGGAARIGASAHVGLGAAVLPGVVVGEGSVVGAGAVLIESLQAGVVAAGVPARVLRRAGDRG